MKFRLEAYFNTFCFKINKYYLKNKKVVNFSKANHFNNFNISLLILSALLAYLFLNWILEKVKIIGRNKNIKNIVAEFQQTKRNSISKDFLIKNNFKYIDVGLIKKKFGIKLKEKGSQFMITDSEKKTKFMEIYEQKK